MTETEEKLKMSKIISIAGQGVKINDNLVIYPEIEQWKQEQPEQIEYGPKLSVKLCRVNGVEVKVVNKLKLPVDFDSKHLTELIKEIDKVKNIYQKDHLGSNDFSGGA
jgi:hypothetical protein